MRRGCVTLACIILACGEADPVADGDASGGATANSATEDVVTTSAGSSTGDGVAGPGEACGPAPCEDGLYCHLHDDLRYCSDEFPGTCTTPPTSCPDDAGPPVCGCDGLLYPSPCHAHMAGVGLANADSCEAPEGMFPCGPDFCQLGVHYCEYTLPHGQTETYYCRELPAECTSPTDCLCVPKEACTNPENIGGVGCDPGEFGWMTVICAPY